MSFFLVAVLYFMSLWMVVVVLLLLLLLWKILDVVVVIVACRRVVVGSVGMSCNSCLWQEEDKASLDFGLREKYCYLFSI